MRTPIIGPTSRIYFSQRLRLHYVDWGNQDVPPLLMLHGGRDHCRNWDWLADRLRGDWHIVAPDLRGHGDSQWSSDGNYAISAMVYDLAQLIYQQKLAPLVIIAHSLGAHIALRYAGIYPENVAKLVAIEGVWHSPRMGDQKVPVAGRLQAWIDRERLLAGRIPRRYATVEEAFRRMQEENKHLSPEQARHLTLHGVNQNEDGTFSWKFDNYVRNFAPHDISLPELEELWGRITCPTLLVHGRESWMSNPEKDGRVRLFRNARVISYENAGHWVHHDRLDAFEADVRAFLAAPDVR